MCLDNYYVLLNVDILRCLKH